MCILVYLYVLNVFVCIFGNGIYIFDCIYLYCVNQPVVPKVWILIGVPVLTYIDVFPCISVCIECTSTVCISIGMNLTVFACILRMQEHILK